MPGFPACKVGSHTAHTPTCHGDGLVLTALTVRITWAPPVCRGSAWEVSAAFQRAPPTARVGTAVLPKLNVISCSEPLRGREKAGEQGAWQVGHAQGLGHPVTPPSAPLHSGGLCLCGQDGTRPPPATSAAAELAEPASGQKPGKTSLKKNRKVLP